MYYKVVLSVHDSQLAYSNIDYQVGAIESYMSSN
jgi:hypothetical protein